jgi:hypothetical protein
VIARRSSQTKMERLRQKWVNVKTTLSDIDTSKIHYVKVPEKHIVIDFDLKDPMERRTLSEISKPLAVGLQRMLSSVSLVRASISITNYAGDPDELASVYSEGIEIKVYTGDASLRRKLDVAMQSDSNYK